MISVGTHHNHHHYHYHRHRHHRHHHLHKVILETPEVIPETPEVIPEAREVLRKLPKRGVSAAALGGSVGDLVVVWTSGSHEEKTPRIRTTRRREVSDRGSQSTRSTSPLPPECWTKSHAAGHATVMKQFRPDRFDHIAAGLGRMQSSGHRLRDMEQHHPLLSSGGDAEAGSLDTGVMDGCGMVCAGITWFLVLYAAFVVNFVMLLHAKNSWYPLLNGAVFNSLAVLALASHLRTMLTDPVRRRRRVVVLVEVVVVLVG
ncbi:hypothetical protein CRUP_003355 [Coryphaenoides rupestris]|nr:hypothetical protein CRUP_003355 [Coryphaenoides rupestris]